MLVDGCVASKSGGELTELPVHVDGGPGAADAGGTGATAGALSYSAETQIINQS